MLLTLCICAASTILSNRAAAIAPPGQSVPVGPSPSHQTSDGHSPALSKSLTPESVEHGYIFDDAGKLKAWAADPQAHAAEIVTILKEYKVSSSNLHENPFLAKVAFLKSALDQKVAAVPVVSVVQPQGTAMKGLFSASSVADTLGSFIADRVKEDAELMALQTLARSMKSIDKSSTGHPLKAAFPKTMGYLATVDAGLIDSSDWAILQADIKVDMAALPQNLPKFLDALYNPAVVTEPQYLTSLAASTGLEIIRNGKQPYGVIDSMAVASSTFVSDHSTGPNALPAAINDLDVALRTLEIASHMLTANGLSRWHSADDIQRYLFPSASLDIDAINLLLGLSYATDTASYASIDARLIDLGQPPLTCANQQANCSAPMQLMPIANGIKALATSFDHIYQDVQTLPVNLDNIAEVEPLLSDILPLADALCDLIASVNPTVDAQAIRAKADIISSQATAVVDIVGFVKQRQYAAAIGTTVTLMRLYVPNDTSTHSGTLTQFLATDGACIAQVAQANTSADASTALDACALKANNYLEIEKTPFSITLNSYFGVTAGAETLLGNLGGTGTARTRAHLGFAAPVGLDFNWGRVTSSQRYSGADSTGEHFFQTGTWSLFVPILDVGAVAAWRLGSGGGQVSAITWSNIVAPGLFAVWSKRGSPFSILFGAQYGPELTKVSTSGAATIERAALQFPCIEFTFNIPVFPLYQSPGAVLGDQ